MSGLAQGMAALSPAERMQQLRAADRAAASERFAPEEPANRYIPRPREEPHHAPECSREPGRGDHVDRYG